MSAHRLFLAVAFMLSAVPGCISIQEDATKILMRQARPNPLNRQTPFRIAPPTFQDFKIGDKTEAEYLSRLSEGTQRSFLLDKDELPVGFSQALRENQGKLNLVATSDQAHLATVNIDFIEPGVSADRIEMQVHATLRIFDPRGQPLDEIQLRVRVHLAADTLTRAARMRMAGRQIGTATAEYLRERTGL